MLVLFTEISDAGVRWNTELVILRSEHHGKYTIEPEKEKNK